MNQDYPPALSSAGGSETLVHDFRLERNLRAHFLLDSSSGEPTWWPAGRVSLEGGPELRVFSANDLTGKEVPVFLLP